MAIKLGQGFLITSTNVIDTRLVLTKAEMKAISDNVMPPKYFTLCSDDNKFYLYDKSRTPDEVTGKFTPVSSSGDIMIRCYLLNGKMYTDSTYTIEVEKNEKFLYIDKNGSNTVYTYSNNVFSPVMPDADENIKGALKLYQLSGLNTDGTMTLKAITDGVNAIKFVIDDSDTECLVLDLPWD